MTLQNFDTVLGFALIMLLLSMVVTVLVQLAVTVMSLRGQNLQAGLAQLLAQASPELKVHAKKIAKAIVHHPAIARQSKVRSYLAEWSSSFSSTYKAKAITRDELICIVDELAAKPPTILRGDALRALRVATGRELPPAKLQNIIETAGELTEALAKSASSVPSSASQQKVTQQTQLLETAILQYVDAKTNLVSNVETWFDSVMNRTKDWFTGKTRAFTVVFAFVLAFGAGIDSMSILQQLKDNDAARTRLAQSAEGMQKDLQSTLQKVQTPANPTVETLNAQLSELKTLNTQIKKTDLVIAIGATKAYEEVGNRWLGMLLTAFFLSLGAPFWFNALGQMAKLRPVIASITDKEAGTDTPAPQPAARAAGAGK